MRALKRILSKGRRGRRRGPAVGADRPAAVVACHVVDSAAAAGAVGGVMWMAGKGFIPAVYGSSDLRRLLRDIEGRYSGAFEELGPGALQDFKHLIDCVNAFLDLLADLKTDFMVKLTSYDKLRMDVFKFCRSPLMERLKAEIYELLEEAISWWGEQNVLDIIGR